jgi:hypothetical protein
MGLVGAVHLRSDAASLVDWILAPPCPVPTSNKSQALAVAAASLQQDILCAVKLFSFLDEISAIYQLLLDHPPKRKVNSLTIFWNFFVSFQMNYNLLYGLR